MVFDPSLDHLVFDGLEAVTLDGVAIANCYKSDVVETEAAPSEGVYQHADVEWQIPTNPVPGRIPAIGYEIADALGYTWVIQSVRRPFAGDYYGCACREGSISATLGLSDLVTRFPAITVVDEEGSRYVDNSAADPAFTNVACKIQPVADEVQDFMGKRGIETVFHIFVASDIDLAYGDVLKDAGMTQYSVQSWENRERIDELSLIVCHLME